MKVLRSLWKRMFSCVLMLALVLSGGAFSSLQFSKHAAAANYIKIPIEVKGYKDLSKTKDKSQSYGIHYLYYSVMSNGKSVEMYAKNFYLDAACSQESYTFFEAIEKSMESIVQNGIGISHLSITDKNMEIDGNTIQRSGTKLVFSDYMASTVTYTPNSTITVYGTLNWTVSLDNQSATTAGTDAIHFEYGAESVPDIAVPSKVGYIFGGYYTEENGGGHQYINDKGVAQPLFVNAIAKNTLKKDKTLYAKWTACTHSYGSYSSVNSSQHERICSKCGYIDRSNHNCVGTVTADATCTAQGTRRYACTLCSYSYTEPIAALGHDYTSKTTTNTYLKTSATKTQPAVYYYKCSRCAAKGTTTYTSGNPTACQITLNQAGATVNGSGSTSVIYGNAMPSGLTAPSRTGYSFKGYYDAATGGTQYYTSAMVSARNWNKGADTTLYAQWTPHSYTIKFNGNGSTGGSMTNMSMSYGTAKNLTANGFTKTGHAFAGWAETPTGSVKYSNGQSVNNLSSTSGGVVTLYAVWEENGYVVTVQDKCGTSVLGSKEFTFHYGQAASAAELLGDSKVIGAYYSDYMLSSCGNATVTGDCTIYRDFISYEGCGLNGSVISDDGRTLVSAGNEVVNVTVPSSVTRIADGAFRDCASLQKVTIPNNSVTSIGKNAFAGCGNLNEISLPFSVATIGTGAFKACINLDSVTIKNPACVIGDDDTTIPGNTEIQAFMGSTGIDFAKKYSRNLEMISAIENDFFCNETSMVKFDVPDNVTAIADNAFKNCTKLASVTLGNVRKIGDNAFINTSISSVVIPDDTTSIGKNAFSDCDSLKEVIFEENSSLETIGNYAFARNLSLRYGTSTSPSAGSNSTTFYLPPTVTEIGSYAFLGCKNLGQVDVTGMETSFGAEVFHEGTVIGTYAGSDAFAYADSNSYQIALWSGYETNQAVQMAENQYKGNANIYSAGFGRYQTEIAAGAFSGCSNLTDVKYSKRLEKIGNQAFSGCQSLESFLSEDETATDWSLSYVGDGAFRKCSSLRNLNIYNPNCVIVQTDGQEADSDKATAVTIPSTVVINAWSKSTAFDYCNKYGLTRNSVGTSYQIIFNKNAGIDGTDKIYAYTGMDWPQVDIPARTGYTFTGYSYNGVKYYDEDGLIHLTGNAINLNNDMMGNSALIAQWKANIYKVSFDANGGAGVMDDVDMTYDEQYHLPSHEFSRTGYTFIGWNTKADGTGTGYTDGRQVSNLSSTMNGEVVLYAQWSAGRYTITFDANSGRGDVPADIEALYGVEYTLAEEKPEKEDYVFTGWNTEADGSGIHYNGGEAVKNLTDADGAIVTLYAEYTAITYDISYDLDGGSMEENKNPGTYTAGDEVNLLNPVKKGYTFTGWTGTEVLGVSTAVTIPAGSRGNRSYTAHWTLNHYSISYDLDGGSLGADIENTKSYTVNTEDFELHIPTKTGHIFLGWQEADDKEPAVYYTVSKGTVGNLEFTAKWKPITYAVHLDTDGGTFDDYSDNITSYVYGVGAVLPLNLTKEGYYFKGWSETVNGTADVTEILPTATGEKAYYAVWTQIKNSECEIHYMDGEVELGAKEVADYKNSNWIRGCKEIPGRLVLPRTAVKTGYTFAGWHEDAGLSGDAVTEFVYTGEENGADTGNKYFYAKWTANTYDVSYQLNGGTCSETPAGYYVYGKGMTLTDEVERQGYTFAGWYEDAGFAGQPLTEIAASSMGAKIFYAKWSPRTYHITYHSNEGVLGSGVKDSYIYGSGIELPADVTRNGCKFEGWYDNKNYAGDAVRAVGNTEMGDKTYYAKWSPRTYHITYVLDGGRIQDIHYVTSYVYNTSAALPTNVVKEGCRFEGWYDNPEFTGNIINAINSVTYGNRTYYAKYVKEGISQSPSPEQTQSPVTSAPVGVPSPSATDTPDISTGKDSNGSAQQTAVPASSAIPDIPGPGNAEVSPNPGTDTVKQAVYVTKNGVTYQITDTVNPAVTISKAKTSDDTSVTIPARLSIKGVSYKVTRIEDKAFQNWKNLEKVTIGKNVEKIGKKVFHGDGKLKKITIKSRRLNRVGSKTLKGVNKNLKIYVPKTRVKKYRKLFKGKGQKRTVRVLAKK